MEPLKFSTIKLLVIPPAFATTLPLVEMILADVVILPVALMVFVLSPVNVGFASGALSAKVDASDAPFNVIAGVEMLGALTSPVNVVGASVDMKMSVMSLCVYLH